VSSPSSPLSSHHPRLMAAGGSPAPSCIMFCFHYKPREGGKAGPGLVEMGKSVVRLKQLTQPSGH
jgi:hypothetical protein